jgi:hypothetical protein
LHGLSPPSLRTTPAPQIRRAKWDLSQETANWPSIQSSTIQESPMRDWMVLESKPCKADSINGWHLRTPLNSNRAKSTK